MIPTSTFRRSVAGALLTAAVAASGCDDSFGPGNWDADVDTVALFALAREEYQGLPAALDIVGDRTRVLEDIVGTTSTVWDIALDDGESGGLQLITPGSLVGLDPSAGIARVTDDTFEGLREAPRDTARYERVDPVQLVEGTVYVIRSRPDPVFSNCIRFAKMELVDADATLGTARIRYTRNPFCDDRALVPPDER